MLVSKSAFEKVQHLNTFKFKRINQNSFAHRQNSGIKQCMNQTFTGFDDFYIC